MINNLPHVITISGMVGGLAGLVLASQLEPQQAAAYGTIGAIAGGVVGTLLLLVTYLYEPLSRSFVFLTSSEPIRNALILAIAVMVAVLLVLQLRDRSRNPDATFRDSGANYPAARSDAKQNS